MSSPRQYLPASTKYSNFRSWGKQEFFHALHLYSSFVANQQFCQSPPPPDSHFVNLGGGAGESMINDGKCCQSSPDSHFVDPGVIDNHWWKIFSILPRFCWSIGGGGVRMERINSQHFAWKGNRWLTINNFVNPPRFTFYRSGRGDQPFDNQQECLSVEGSPPACQ